MGNSSGLTTVLDDEFVFESGLKRVRVMRVGEPIDVADAIAAFVPAHCQDWVLDLEPTQEGKIVVRHHLEFFYPYRDLVAVRPQGWDGKDTSGLVYGIFWRRTGRERMSQVITDAADAYWGRFDCAPKVALIAPMPKAPVTMTLGGCCDGAMVSIAQMTWMPRAAVVVCGQVDWMEAK